MSLSTILLLIPDWAALLTILFIIVPVSLAGFFLVHRLIPVKVRLIHNDVAGFVFSVVGVMYAVLLAFVIVVVWEQYRETQTHTNHEVSTALALYRTMEAYAESIPGKDLRPMLRDYLEEILEVEYPAMRRMEPVELANARIRALWTQVGRLAPASSREQVLYQEMLGGLSALERLRTGRLADARDEVPGVIWFALIAGAALTIGFAFLLGTENVGAHATMIAVLAALISVIFFVIIELDHPFSGTVSIEAEHFQQLARLAPGH